MNTFRTLVRKLFKFSLHKRKVNAETILDFQGFNSSEKNSFRGNYSQKYGSFFSRLGKATCTVHLISAPDHPEQKELHHYVRETRNKLTVLIYILIWRQKVASLISLRDDWRMFQDNFSSFEVCPI